MSSFIDLNLPGEISQALMRMKFAEPTPVQEKAIPLALEGRDIIISAQTGTGKTAAFGIPLLTRLLKEPQSKALILAPTRELAAQIVAELRKLASAMPRFEISLLIGGVGIWSQRRSLSAAPRIMVATPGRMVDHLRTQRKLLSSVNILVLDEADRMLDLGFAPQLKVIREALPVSRQTMLFSATYPTDIVALAEEWLKNPERIAIGSVSKPVEKINQAMVEIEGDEKNDTLLSELERREGSVLVFARTKRRTDKLSRFLKDSGVAACQIHGDRTQSQREFALSGFRSGKFRVLVATDIAARGIDVPHIAHVINYDLPYVPEDYLHRIGRTARAGRTGEALCLVAPEERILWRNIQRLMAKKEGLSSAEQRQMSQKGGRGAASAGRRGEARGGARGDRRDRGFGRGSRPDSRWNSRGGSREDSRSERFSDRRGRSSRGGFGGSARRDNREQGRAWC